MSIDEAVENTGRRVILRPAFPNSDEPYEAVIAEVSPSKRLVKLRYPGGVERWTDIKSTDHLEEILP